MRNNRTLLLTRAAMTAAIYVVLTYFINAFGLASGAIQIRISEALCILPVFMPEAIPGLTIGCLLSNILTGCALPDILFGTLATFIGALGTYALRKRRFIFTLPPVISNMVIIPLVLKFAYGVGDAWLLLMITVGIGEAISVCGIGMVLYAALKKVRHRLFPAEKPV